MTEQERPKHLDRMAEEHERMQESRFSQEVYDPLWVEYCLHARYAKVLEGRIAEAIAEFRQAAAAPMAEKNLLFDIAMDTLLGRTDD